MILFEYWDVWILDIRRKRAGAIIGTKRTWTILLLGYQIIQLYFMITGLPYQYISNRKLKWRWVLWSTLEINFGALGIDMEPLHYMFARCTIVRAELKHGLSISCANKILGKISFCSFFNLSIKIINGQDHYHFILSHYIGTRRIYMQ